MSQSSTQQRRTWVILACGAAAIVLLGLIFYAPAWWVSLKAPQYPAEAFPDGVRIDFHMNGVFNGCQLLSRKEIVEEQALDCVHEMDAINHFVGMFPIASGGVVEKFFSPFLISMLGFMILGFVIERPWLRLAVMGAGFAAVAAWMSIAFLMPGGIAWQNAGYLQAMVTSLGQGEEEVGEEQSPVIAALKKSLIESGAGGATDAAQLQKSVESLGESKLGEALSKLHQGQAAGQGKTLKEILSEASQSKLSGKALSIAILKSAFEADQARKPEATRQAWNGSGAQVLGWHHEKSLGRWFNQPEKNGPIAHRMLNIAYGLFVVVLAGMAAMLYVGRNNGRLSLLLALLPVLLPVFFIIEYSAWLWWYGHSLNEMGAFTLKPFMPTVFGQGKVAQFTTYSYPSSGFAFMLAMSALMLLALLVRRKQQAEGSVGA